MENYWDDNGVMLHDGHVIDIHQTVNGVSFFYISSIERKEAYYVNEGGTVSRSYEYDFLGLIEGADFTILNQGMARLMKEAFEEKMQCQKAAEKCLDLFARIHITTDQKERIKIIYDRSKKARALIMDRFNFMLQETFRQK